MQALTRDELKHMNEVAHDDFVLSPDKFNKQHIRTSINIPHKKADFVETVEEVAKDRKVVVYCASFECDASPTAARMLEGAGSGHVPDPAY